MLSQFLLQAAVEYENSLCYNIAKDFVLPVSLAIVSARIAWVLFVRQIVNDKKNEKLEKEEDLKNKLTYFSVLVENAIDNSKKQTFCFLEDLKKKKNSGIRPINLTKHPTFDLEIIAEKIDLEDYLLSYLKFYKRLNKMQVLKEFKDIIDSCCIINIMLKIPIKSLEEKIKVDENLKKIYLEKLDVFANCFQKSLDNLRDKKDPMFDELQEIYKKMQEINGNNLYLIAEEKYKNILLPTFNLLDKSHRTDKIEFDIMTHDLWIASTNAKIIYEDILGGTINLMMILDNTIGRVKGYIDLLEKSSAKIRNEFLT